MNSHTDILDKARSWLEAKFGLAVIVAIHSTVTCLSLIKVANFQSYIHFSNDRVWIAVAVALAFSTVSLMFVFARFSFGYFVGFYFYTMILGFLWIDTFSQYDYARLPAGVSAALSLLLFLIPALFVRAPLRQISVLSTANFERLLHLILALSVATIAAASTYSFRLVSITQIYEYRNTLEFPGALRYLIGWVSSALLPFSFACFWLLGYYWRSALVLILLLLFYPITLTKFAFFTPAWLIALTVLSRLVQARTSAILSIFVPILIGLSAIAITNGAIDSPSGRYFDLVNIRMMATASSALDIYNHFFASHPLTWFCQISLVKTVTYCPYQEPLAVVMQNTYGFGNINASLFATEGVASVGIYLAPLTALLSGFIIALGNRVAAGLPASFVLLSSGVLPHILLNVPLTVAMVTHGAALLFLLWYVMPRDLFQQKP